MATLTKPGGGYNPDVQRAMPKGDEKEEESTLNLGLRNHLTSHSISPAYSFFSPILKWSAFNNWDGAPPGSLFPLLQSEFWGVDLIIMLQTASCRNTAHLSTPINQKEILWIWHQIDRDPSTTILKRVTNQRTDLTSLSLALGTAIFLVSQTGTPKLSCVLAIYPLPFKGQIPAGVGP